MTPIIEIGPYLVGRRTQYSKLQLFDKKSGKNITKGNEAILEKIVQDYTNQLSFPNNYFITKGCSIVEISELAKRKTDYLFIPDGITSIYKYAFSEGVFKYINLPDTLEKIEERAFCACRQLVSLDIPDNVQLMGSNIFSSCVSLKEIKLPNVKRIPQGLLYNCNSLKEVNIPDSVNYIDIQAFDKCMSLETVKIPKNVEVLSYSAFAECRSLENIKLPERLRSIGKSCFRKCGLKEIEIPDNVSEISEAAFENCKNLEHIKLPSKLKLLSGQLFCGCLKLKEIYIPDGVERFADNIFSEELTLSTDTECECPKVEKVNIPQKLKDIVGYPFQNSNIKTLCFDYDLKNLDMVNFLELDINHKGLIYGSRIDKLVISNSVKTITGKAFRGCGEQITSIDYIGTKKQFETFKNNNAGLFDFLPNVKEVNYIKPKQKSEIDISNSFEL